MFTPTHQRQRGLLGSIGVTLLAGALTIGATACEADDDTTDTHASHGMVATLTVA